MDQNDIFLTIIGMGVVTFVPRLLPVLLLSSKTLPESITRWLGYIPVAVLSAMLVPAIFVKEESIAISGDNLFLWVSIPTFIVAAKTKSLFATVMAGMLMVAGFRLLMS